ncbi:hypothetical protein [Nocardioides sp. R-C-SC26]|uniref:hypothetical protein n=1 Tax=Nocardioides sp. R-C-SC26 TaxID=2870414 RepID=UPI001E5F7CE9|nr:hypothetical protein [Nocardioides sp. R-C-SC26]
MTRSRTLARATASAGALVLALALAACGSDDSDGDNGESEETSSISKADFVEKANAICEAGDEKEEDFAEPTTEDEAIDLVRNDVLPNISDQIQQIRDLGFPEGDEDLLGGILDDADAIIAEIDADPIAALQQENPFAEVGEAMNEYGITECVDA